MVTSGAIVVFCAGIVVIPLLIWIIYLYLTDHYYNVVVPERIYQKARNAPEYQALFQSIIDDLQSLPMLHRLDFDHGFNDGRCMELYWRHERTKEAMHLIKRMNKLKIPFNIWLDVDAVNNGIPYTEEQFKMGRAEYVFRKAYIFRQTLGGGFKFSPDGYPAYFKSLLREIREKEARKVIRDPKNVEKIAQVISDARACPLQPDIIEECSYQLFQSDPISVPMHRDGTFVNLPKRPPRKPWLKMHYSEEKIRERLELLAVYNYAYKCVDEAYPVLAKHAKKIGSDYVTSYLNIY